jgi:hypothetical protein
MLLWRLLNTVQKKNRGPQEPVIAHLVFNLTSKVDRKYPPFKMAAVTKNRNFFKCPLLLYYKSK